MGKMAREDDFQKQVIALAQMRGWRVAHFRPAQTQRGNWVTPVQADGKGFPDLVMVRRDRLIFAELKAVYRKPTPEQQAWLSALSGVETEAVEVFVWNERDFPEIARVLR